MMISSDSICKSSKSSVEHADAQAKLDQACTVAIRFLGIQKKASGRIRAYLLEKGFTQEIAELAVEALRQRGYLDDSAIAVRMIRSRSGRRSVSVKAHRHYLSRAGIPPEITESLLSNLPPDDVSARTALKFRYPQPDQALAASMLRFLSSRGFSRTAAVQAVKNHLKVDVPFDQG